MTLPLANRCSGTQKIRILPIAGCDPECQRTEKIKVCWQHFIYLFFGVGIKSCAFQNINSPFIATASLFLAVIREPG